jgi:hypothetical protein
VPPADDASEPESDPPAGQDPLDNQG